MQLLDTTVIKKINKELDPYYPNFWYNNNPWIWSEGVEHTAPKEYDSTLIPEILYIGDLKK